MLLIQEAEQISSSLKAGECPFNWIWASPGRSPSPDGAPTEAFSKTDYTPQAKLSHPTGLCSSGTLPKILSPRTAAIRAHIEPYVSPVEPCVYLDLNSWLGGLWVTEPWDTATETHPSLLTEKTVWGQESGAGMATPRNHAFIPSSFYSNILPAWFSPSRSPPVQNGSWTCSLVVHTADARTGQGTKRAPRPLSSLLLKVATLSRQLVSRWLEANLG